MKNKFFIITIILFFIIISVFYFIKNQNTNNGNITNLTQTTSTPQVVDEISTTRGILYEPIKDAKAIVTKKPFAIKISPTNSPISPEKFSGYHTGVDFETTVDEQDKDIFIYAICDGNLLLKKQATGYGGVVVQECNLNGEVVTVIYGHLKLESINQEIGTKLISGTQIGILGKGYSTETSGERKHLHLGIHKGTSINILGYVQNEIDLRDWIDVLKFL